MYKKIILIAVMFVTSTISPFSLTNLFSKQQSQDSEQQVSSSEVAVKLVKLVEYIYAGEQANILTQDAEKKREEAHSKEYRQIALQYFDGMWQADYDTMHCVKDTLKDFNTVTSITKNDLEEAQKDVPWLQEPIAQYLMRKLAHEYAGGSLGIPALKHVGSLIEPHVQPEDVLPFHTHILRQECKSKCSNDFPGRTNECYHRCNTLYPYE